jgi:hypothetical protein
MLHWKALSGFTNLCFGKDEKKKDFSSPVYDALALVNWNGVESEALTLSSPKSEETLTILPSEEACSRGSSASVTFFVP